MDINFDETKTKARQKANFDKCFLQESKDGICMLKNYSNCLEPIELGGDEYHYFPMHGTYSTWWLCIRKSAVLNKKSLKIKVARRDVGKVVGRGGENIKAITKKLGLKHIKVEGC